MRRLLVTSVLLAGLMLSGCMWVSVGPSDRSSQESPEEPFDFRETAALFTFAYMQGDAETLAGLVPIEDDASVRDEITTIEGDPVDASEIVFEPDDMGLTAWLDDEYVMVFADDDPGNVFTSSGSVALALSMVASDAGWLVEEVDGTPAANYILRLGPAGKRCMDNLETLTMAAKSARADSADYVAPDTVEVLVPEYIPEPLTCPTGGTYTIDENAVVTCSRHGSYE